MSRATRSQGDRRASLRRMMRVCLALLLASSSGAAAAAEGAVKPTLALVGGQMIDGYEGPPLRDGVVLDRGHRIIGRGAALTR